MHRRLIFARSQRIKHITWYTYTPLRLRLHGTGTENRSEPNRICFRLHGTVWNRFRCLHGTVLEPPGTDPNGSRTGPTNQQVPCKQKAYPVRISMEPVPCKHSLRWQTDLYVTPSCDFVYYDKLSLKET